MAVDSAGVRIVQHPELSRYPSPVHRPEYLLVIGEAEGPQELVFGEVGGADIMSDGSVAVLDRLAAEVRLFAPDGTLLRTIGRRGEGPGELSGRLTLGLLALSDNRLALPDAGNETITIFDVTGGVEGIHRFDVSSVVAPEWRSLSGDTIVVRVVGANREYFVRRTVTGDWQDTLATVERIEHRPTRENPGWPLMPEHWVWSASDTGRLLLGRMTRPELRVYQESVLQSSVSWGDEGYALDQADVSVLLRIVARNQGVQSGIPQEIREMMSAPERAHVLADVSWGPQGVMMAQRLRPLVDMDERILSTMGARGFGGSFWEIFSSEGEYLGVLDFGANVEVLRVRGDTVVGVRDGSFGGTQLFLARLPRTLGAKPP